MSTVHDLPDLAPPTDDDPAKFPAAPYESAAIVLRRLRRRDRPGRDDSVEPAAVDQAAAILLDAYTRGATVFSCGNGGSASIANHLQCDHVKGVGTRPTSAPRAEPEH